MGEAPWRERDLKLEVFTEHEGLQEYVVRSARTVSSKLRPHALVFDRTILTVAARGMTRYVTQARLEERLRFDRALLTRQRAVAVACALVRLARPDVADTRRLFASLDKAVQDINQRTAEFLLPLFGLIAQVLTISGIAPLLDQCRTCHQPVDRKVAVLFSLTDGAIFHEYCAHPLAAEPLLADDWQNLCRVLAGKTVSADPAVFQWLVKFAKYHLEAKMN